MTTIDNQADDLEERVIHTRLIKRQCDECTGRGVEEKIDESHALRRRDHGLCGHPDTFIILGRSLTACATRCIRMR
jgi:hypothetical protein